MFSIKNFPFLKSNIFGHIHHTPGLDDVVSSADPVPLESRNLILKLLQFDVVVQTARLDFQTIDDLLSKVFASERYQTFVLNLDH